MDDGWLLLAGFLRLPMVARRRFAAVLCAALLQFVALWRRQRLQIQWLRYGTISVASLLYADAASLRSRGAIGLAASSLQPCAGRRERSSGVYNRTTRKKAALEESRVCRLLAVC